ncbi:tRNA pseudouridine(38/39) synthase [Eurytemora carolleeae]|uniref:tRNA pseudouridine(38/39) synthase n=1 Tax=Eurytemora carolleeae TaxID=1294199 RepID=UPI000C757838|nr:tRNA pseudouridine(38/39) synthase [Eurytemora carolleeae]|eukprot:XP_023334180.1 tRNA pseudouridine(38/39) synthase-like [Eurytemora affinis]
MSESKINEFKLDPLQLKQKKIRTNLEDLSRDELIQKIISLEVHVQQLRNVIAKNSNSDLPVALNAAKKERKFDFSNYKRRHVLLKICYFGWDYHGFAVQEDSGKTIESELFAALHRTKLIESREQSNYHRCGRTDRGVSAFSQVVSLDIRTNLAEGEGVYAQDSYTGSHTNIKDTEIDYCHILNRNLPDNIKVTAWAPTNTVSFSARFDCQSRTYKYFFPRGLLDLQRMEDGGQNLVGSHDFRNFCKMDVNNGVVSYTRRVDALSVSCVLKEDKDKDSPYDMCVLTIVGKAYLWHQIRLIVSVLFLIGEGKEDPSVVKELLDVEKNPQRPAYGMAADYPLNLFSCDYDGVEWNYDQLSLGFVLRTFQKMWVETNVKSQMIRSCLEDLEKHAQTPVHAQVDPLFVFKKEKVYTPLLKMPKCPSLEDKIVTVAKRRKLDID